MRVKRIGWAGTRTSEYPAMVAFLQAVLGLTTSQEGFDFAAFQLPEGGTFEVFGPADQDHEHFSTGPVVGFVVMISPAPCGSWRQPGWSSWAGRWMSAAAVGAIFGHRTATSTSSPAGSVKDRGTSPLSIINWRYTESDLRIRGCAARESNPKPLPEEREAVGLGTCGTTSLTSVCQLIDLL